MTAPIIDMKSLNKFYQTYQALYDITLSVEVGEFVALVGPSGCGKTSLLKILAGFEELTSGTLEIEGKDMRDVPPSERPTRMVFQKLALFPHKTIFDNIAFPLKMAKMNQAEIDKRVDAAAQVLNLTDYIDRRPGQLSGGQRQRVAIGRAIVREPAAFLMDEPLSNLDAKLRVQTRSEIVKLQRRLGVTTIYVTHDQTEALTMADKIVVMKGGEIQQVGSAEQLFHAPVNVFVAGFIGSPAMNFIEGTLTPGKKPVFTSGDLSIPMDGYNLTQTLGKAPMQGVTLGIRPEHVLFGDASSSAPFSREVVVEVVEPMGADTLVWAMIGDLSFRFRVEGQLQLRSGDKVTIGFDPARGSMFDAEENRI